MTYCIKGRSVFSTKSSGVIYFSFLSDYEYWVFSEVALAVIPWTNVTENCGVCGLTYYCKVDIGLYKQYFGYGLGKHCMS